MAAPLVLIAGAGPTGMAAAIELKRAGLDVRVIDKATHLAEHSQALAVQARTLEQFQRYGIAAEAVERGHPLTRVKFWSEGKNIVSVDLGRIPSRFPFLLLLPQSDTEEILNRHMESLGVVAERGTELVSLTQPEGLIEAVLRGQSGEEERLNPDWVIGCDGAHSTIRSLMEIPFEGGGVGLSFFLGDMKMEGPDAPVDEIALHFHHGDVVFMARLPHDVVRLIVAVHALENQELGRELTTADFQNVLDSAGIQVKVHSPEWMTPFRVNDLQARHYRAGSVFLAGDASHIHSPVGGQGMNTGIQDVANLAWKMAAVGRGADPKLLDSYEAERAPVGKALLRFTERGLKLATTTNPLLEAIRDAILPLATSLRTVQKNMLGFISETAIEYRSSAIVADHGGDGELRAGDRLPELRRSAENGGRSVLEDWTEGRHLVLVVNSELGEEEAVELQTALQHAIVRSVSTPEFDEDAVRLLGAEEKILVVRPDGYIGFRGPLDRVLELEVYARQDGLA
jgi:2-polyprenyl-6-methoxyphenol hydroxylase-like FAD-dependent oxidoreductase